MKQLSTEEGLEPGRSEAAIQRERIFGFLKQAEAGAAVKELCRANGFSDASFYKWRGRVGGMESSDCRNVGVEIE